MIRVLHVVSSLGVGSGIMSCLMNYYRFIDKTQVQFDFLFFRSTENTYQQEIHALGGRTYPCSKPALTGKFPREVDEFFTKHGGEYPIVHCHPIYCTAFFAAPAKRHGVKHVIQHSHTTKFSDKPLSALRNWVVNTACGHLATDHAACSEKAKALFWWKDSADIKLMPNAIDYDCFRFSQETRDRVRKELGLEEGDLVLGHVGRFSPQKNHGFLLKVFDAFYEKNPRAKLLLVGDGSTMPQVQQQAKELPCGENVLFLGRHGKVQDFYCAMDLFLLPSLFEGLAVVLVEAQASGLPCYVADTVTDEADMSGNVQFLPLSKGEAYWASQLETQVSRDRNAVRLDRLFNIRIAAGELLRYYQSLAE